MYKKLSIYLALLLACTAASAQKKVVGKVVDSTNRPLVAATISLLNKQDSTFEAFSVSTKDGSFEIRDVKDGSYLLQASYIGYFTEYIPVTINSTASVFTQNFKLSNTTANLLPGVVVMAEKIPIKLKGDTLEYNASSFKTKPDAVVEDLLKKLPGIQVDGDGKIKAMGKDVKKVLVDGKEFFGDDPLVATKNLPANAVSKIQTYEGKNDNAAFTGIDEGDKEQTINILLKDNKKQGYFGDVMAGGGNNERYESSLKGFKFNKQKQIAVLGMHNNINKFGFSFKDYLNFNGGITGLLNGKSTFEIDQDEPIDVGQPQPGNINSTALGFNYTTEKRANNILNVNYLGSFSNRFQINNSLSQNFLGNTTFNNIGASTRNSRTNTNRIFGKWRNNIDSMNQINTSIKANIKNGGFVANSLGEALINNALINATNNASNGNNNSFNIGGTFTYIKKFKSNLKYLRLTANAEYIGTRYNNNWDNEITFFSIPSLITSNIQMQQRESRELAYKLAAASMYKIGFGLYVKGEIDGYASKEKFEQIQGLTLDKLNIIDSVSPLMATKFLGSNLTLSLVKSLKKYNWSIGVKNNLFAITPTFNNIDQYTKQYFYVLPFANYTRNVKGKTTNVSYTTSVKNPNSNDLLPTADISLPIITKRGNINLIPEFGHNFIAQFNKFNQFNFSFYNVSLTGSYTKNKIGFARTIAANLNQEWISANLPYAANIRLAAGSSLPINFLHLNMNADVSLNVSRNETPINNVLNENNTITQLFKLNFTNKKGNKLEFAFGGSYQVTNSTYSLDARANNITHTYTANASFGYKLSKTWYLSSNYNLSHYNAENFSNKLTIPLLGAEISKMFLKNNRGTLSLRAFDLLNRNVAIVQQSQQNSFIEQRSNIIGQYFMMSFKFKLNKLGKNGSLIE